MKMNSLALVGALFVASVAQASATSVKVKCDDDISGQVTVVTIDLSNPLKAKVRVRTQDDTFYFPAHSVRVRRDNKGYFVMFEREALEIPYQVFKKGYGMGVYQDGGDSRAVECEVLR